MEKITLESFTAILRRERDVCVTFGPNCERGAPSMYRYQVNEHGSIFEVYNYNHTIYPVCHIDDERSMSDNFLMPIRSALKIEATSREVKEQFNGIFD